MPKSKRAKIVTLSRTEKKTKDSKDEFFSQIRECADKYTYCYVIAIENMRNTFLKEIRTHWKDTGRIFMGRNKVMQKSLGTSPESEYKLNLHHLSSRLTSGAGLFFTSSPPSVVTTYFSNFREVDYARTGAKATKTVEVKEGPVVRGDDEEAVPHTMEPELRRLGMPTRLVKGVVTVMSDYRVCGEGEVLSSSQATLLKHFWIPMAEFKVNVLGYWSAEDNEYREMMV